MADFPDNIFAQRTITNRVGQVYDSSKQTTIYAEDIIALGDEVTAIEEYIEDNIIGGWQTWTPTVSQGTSTNISKTVTYARYKIVGGSYVAQCSVAISGTGDDGNPIKISLPFETAEDNQFCGFFGCYINALVKVFIGGAVSQDGGTTIVGSRDNSNPANYMGQDPNVAVNAGSVLLFNINGKVAE